MWDSHSGLSGWACLCPGSQGSEDATPAPAKGRSQHQTQVSPAPKPCSHLLSLFPQFSGYISTYRGMLFSLKKEGDRDTCYNEEAP